MKRIESRDNALVKRVRALSASARERRKLGETLLDGPHLLAEALRRQWPLKTVLFSDSGLRNAEIAALATQIEASAPATPTPCVNLADPVFAQLSPVDTPSGVLAIIELPVPSLPEQLQGSVVVLDGVQDSGNLGSILRTAAAAGIADILLGEGCAQAWSPRALRAGMGAHFVLRIHEQLDLLAALEGFHGDVLATALGSGARELYALDLNRPVAWLFGGEGQGLSPALLARADERVLIPMAAGVESLNVGAAAAVCLFEQLRQRGASSERHADAS